MPLPSFHSVRFPEDISYGSNGGPGFNTTIIELASGAEQRNINWSQARATYDASYGVKTREQMDALLEFFWARRGKAYGFRYKDWMDFSIERQPIGYTDSAGNATLQVFKRYEPLTSYFFDRTITKLVPTSPGTIWVDGVSYPATDATTGGNTNYDTGIISFSIIGAATKLVEVAFEFDVPVRFDTDEVKISQDDYELMSWPTIPIVELKNV